MAINLYDLIKQFKSIFGEKANSGESPAIEVIQKNGTPITPVDKTVNIIVPTSTSDLNNDSGFITAENIPSDDTKVDKMLGSRLMTSEEAVKLGTIQAYAQPNTIQSITYGSGAPIEADEKTIKLNIPEIIELEQEDPDFAGLIAEMIFYWRKKGYDGNTSVYLPAEYNPMAALGTPSAGGHAYVSAQLFNSSLDKKANIDDVYTKEEVESLINSAIGTK